MNRLLILGTCLAMLAIAAPLASAEGDAPAARSHCQSADPTVDFVVCCPLNWMFANHVEQIPTCYV